MKWINAERQVTVTIYDEEREEHLGKTMTVEEMLDTYTNEGCPAIYINPERKKGKWIDDSDLPFDVGCRCSVCGASGCASYWNYCPHCGSDNGGEQDGPDKQTG